MAMRGDPPTIRVLALGTLLSLIVIGSALLVGTVHWQVLLGVSAVTIVTASVFLFLERNAIRRVPGPALVLFGLSCWTLLQAIAMPISVLDAIAPYNADVWARALRPFGEVPLRAGSISLDPGASYVEALKWFIYALVFILAQRFVRETSTRAGLAIAFVSAVVVSVVTLAHGLTGTTALFGIYTPESAQPRWGVSPILNPNNLSGYLNLGAFCGLGLLMARRPGDGERRVVAERGVIAGGIAVVIGVSVLAASRGGVLGLALGILVLSFLLLLLRRRARNGGRGEARTRARVTASVITATAGGLLLAVVGGNHATWDELRDTSTEKVRLWSWSVPLIRDFPWFGVGRGAFGTIFPAYRGLMGRIVFTHAENFVVQWISEWGIPVAVAALAALAWTCRPRLSALVRDRAKVAAYVGVVILLFQNLVDLALEIPAIAIALFTVLASLWEDPYAQTPGAVAPARTASSDKDRLRRLRRTLFGRGARRALSYGVFATGLVVFWLALSRGEHDVDDERTEMHQLFDATAFGEPPVLQGFLARLRQSVLRHPAEPYFPLLGALAANHTKGAPVLPWVVAALERDMLNARAHMVLAFVLMRNHAVEQALMEMRFAVQYDIGLSSVMGDMAGRMTHDVDRLDRAAPNGRAGAAMLVAAAMAAHSKDERQLRSQILERALAHDPAYVDARVSLAHELLTALSEGVAPCAPPSRSDCIERVRADADAVARLDANSCEPLVLRARAFRAEGNLAQAEALLAEHCSSCQDKASCALERLQMIAQLGEAEPLAAAARAYLGAACVNDDRCSGAHAYIGDQFASRGLWPVAAEHYQEAASKGRKADWWLRAANAFQKAGLNERASLALLRARRDGAGDSTVESRIQAVQAGLGQRDAPALK